MNFSVYWQGCEGFSTVSMFLGLTGYRVVWRTGRSSLPIPTFQELAHRVGFPYIHEFAQTTRKYFVSVEPDYFGGNEEVWMVTHTQRWFCCTQTAVRRPRNSTGFPP